VKSLSPTTLARLDEPLVLLAALITFALAGGSVLRLTDHDAPVTRGGQTWQPLCGLRRTATSISAGLDVNGQDLSGYFETGGITEAMIDSGALDNARVTTMLADVRDPDAYDVIPLLPGRVGDIKTERDTFTLQLNDDAELLQQRFGEATSPDCRANLGDARCKKVLTSFTHTGTITSLVNARRFGVSVSQAAGYFAYGLATFTSGANAGLQFEIKLSTTGEIELFLPPWLTVAIGDAVTLVAGCDKTRATCKAKFGNVINFRGEPDVPGVTALTASAAERL
jgi:uncharacterized phage protein (TIGR02218 family)